MPKTDFSATQVARIAGINYRTLDRWLTQGVLTCDVPAAGTGSRRRFEYLDVLGVVVARSLGDRGLHMSAIRRHLTGLRACWADGCPADAGYLVLEECGGCSRGVWVDGSGEIAALLAAPRGQDETSGAAVGLFVVIDLADLARRVRASMADCLSS